MPELKDQVKRLRKGRRLTIRGLAEVSGISPAYISRLERGEATNVGLKTLETLAAGLGVSVIELCGPEEAQTLPFSSSPPRNEALARELGDQIAGLEFTLKSLRRIQQDLEMTTGGQALPNEDDYYKALGREIAQRREQFHLTQVKLAERLGVTSLTISRWETAARRPSAYDLLLLADAGIEVNLMEVNHA